MAPWLSSSAPIASPTTTPTARSSKPPSKPRDRLPRRRFFPGACPGEKQERGGQIMSYQSRTSLRASDRFDRPWLGLCRSQCRRIRRSLVVLQRPGRCRDVDEMRRLGRCTVIQQFAYLRRPQGRRHSSAECRAAFDRRYCRHRTFRRRLPDSICDWRAITTSGNRRPSGPPLATTDWHSRRLPAAAAELRQTGPLGSRTPANAARVIGKFAQVGRTLIVRARLRAHWVTACSRRHP
jgi:hypothetical protein